MKNIFSLLNLDHLNSEEKKSIESICAKFSQIFHLSGDKLTTTSLGKQSIYIKPGVAPVFTKQYRVPQTQKLEIEKQLKQLLDNDVIEPCCSDWSSPILLVPKKRDGNEKKWRLVVDYRKLNESVQDDKYPLPNIVEILDSLSGSVYFTTLDLFSGLLPSRT